MLNSPLKNIQEHIEFLKDIRWLKENMSKMFYPQEININDLDKLEVQMIKEIFELLKYNNN